MGHKGRPKATLRQSLNHAIASAKQESGSAGLTPVSVVWVLRMGTGRIYTDTHIHPDVALLFDSLLASHK